MTLYYKKSLLNCKSFVLLCDGLCNGQVEEMMLYDKPCIDIRKWDNSVYNISDYLKKQFLSLPVQSLPTWHTGWMFFAQTYCIYAGFSQSFDTGSFIAGETADFAIFFKRIRQVAQQGSLSQDNEVDGDFCLQSATFENPDIPTLPDCLVVSRIQTKTPFVWAKNRHSVHQIFSTVLTILRHSTPDYQCVNVSVPNIM